MSTPANRVNPRTRKLPPFGAILQQRLADRTAWPRWAGTSPDGKHVSIWIGIGPHCWDWARSQIDRRLLLILPPGEDPAAFSWRILAGRDPIVLYSCGDTGGVEVQAIIAGVMRDGVRRVVHGGSGGITRYRIASEVSRAAAA